MRYFLGHIWKIQAVTGGNGIKDSQEVRKSAMRLSVGSVQTEEAMSAEALQWDHTWLEKGMMSRVIEDEDAGVQGWRCLERRKGWMACVCVCMWLGGKVECELLCWHQERESPSFHNRFPSCAAETEGGSKSYQLSCINNGVKGLYYKYLLQIRATNLLGDKNSMVLKTLSLEWGWGFNPSSLAVWFSLALWAC